MTIFSPLDVEAAAKAIFETDPECSYDPDNENTHWRRNAAVSPEHAAEVYGIWTKMATAALTAAIASAKARGAAREGNVFHVLENGRWLVDENIPNQDNKDLFPVLLIRMEE